VVDVKSSTERRRGLDRRRARRRHGDGTSAGNDVPAVAAFPTRQADIARWVRHELKLAPEPERALLDGIDALLARQERLWQASKADAIEALVSSFTDRMNRLRQELSARDVTVANITQYFEHLVSDLTSRANQDPKTRLMNFTAFLEHLEISLGMEQRGTWCAVGLVDVRAFKWYNDTLGHDVGDRLIDTVARLLRQHVRSEDVVAQEERTGQDLHARFGGDEFCFMVPNLDAPGGAVSVANRFGDAVAAYDWRGVDERLTDHPVRVDIGIACLRLGPLGARKAGARQLARDLLAQADRLMYAAKADQATHAYQLTLQLENGVLVPVGADTGTL
jgi:diguanylate cyclase (GGDEF)-like protein